MKSEGLMKKPMAKPAKGKPGKPGKGGKKPYC